VSEGSRDNPASTCSHSAALARFRQMLQVNAEGFMPEDESGWFLDGS
jgi:hypothetical protein